MMFGVYKEGDYAALRLPPKQVIQACRAFLQARKDRIHSEREELIASIMTRGQRQWPRFWQKRYPNRTEAIMIAKDEGDIFGSPWSDIEMRGWIQADRVSDLLKLAHVANVAYEPFIVLSERAVRDLGSYLEGEESGNDEEGEGAVAETPRGVDAGARNAPFGGCVTGHPYP